ncbi:MAG: small multi-drug export protein [Methanoregulaceae archaeon]|jgi:phosphate/sulfate permease
MEHTKTALVEIQIGKILSFFLLIGIGVPLLIGIMLGIPITTTLSFIGSTAVLQALAAPIGVLLNLDPWVVMALMVSFAFGIVLAIQELLRTFSLTSDRVSRWLSKIEQKMQDHQSLHRYGAVSCIFIAWIPGIGLYGTPAIAWILRWDRVQSAIFTVTGFFLASLLMIVIAEGAAILF